MPDRCARQHPDVSYSGTFEPLLAGDRQSTKGVAKSAQCAATRFFEVSLS
jgi:hypothetical protein